MPTKKELKKQRDEKLLQLTAQHVDRLREDEKTWRKFYEEACLVLRK